MWTIIIFAILGLILGIIICDFSDGSWIGAMLLGFIVGFFIAILIPAKKEKKEIITTYELVCLQDNNSLSGNFFIGCGTINGTMKYVYYYNVTTDNKKGFKQGQIDCDDDITIYYADSSPYIEQIITKNVKSEGYFINHFAIDIDWVYKKYNFYIPTGSIKQDYNLDAK